MKPRLLDLFCGAGGCSRGYVEAGFSVLGVDIDPHPDYPFPFARDDALRVLRGKTPQASVLLEWADVIHASPPCQGYVGWQNIATARGSTNDHPRLIEPVRDLLRKTGKPYVIENVVGAPLESAVLLCGTMFGLGVQRHRRFESNYLLRAPGPCRHSGKELGVYGKLDGRRLFTRTDGTELRNPSSLEQAQAAMGINWMRWDDLKEAIPPAMTEWVGTQLLDALGCAA